MEAQDNSSRPASSTGQEPGARKKSIPTAKEGVPGGDANLPAKTPNKNLTKAERRAIQEAQRAAKAAGQATKVTPNNSRQSSATSITATPAQSQPPQAKQQQQHQAGPSKHVQPARLELFSHLPVNAVRSTAGMDLGINSKLHPAVIRAGLLFNRGVITSSNMRCQVMLEALKQMINSYEGAVDKELRRDLEAKLRPHISYLTECRPMSVSMRNAVKFLKLTISNLDPALSEEEEKYHFLAHNIQAKRVVLEEIDHFLRARIELAVAEISKLARDRIVDGDVIVTFSAPQAVETALVDAWRAGRRFTVHVVDTRPGCEGRPMIQRLSANGIPCAYSLIHAAGDAMKDATKVFLGAHTFFANGYMMAPCGAAVVALAAKVMGRPVLVCCETYKFWAQRVQTDSFVFNELDNPDLLAAGTELAGWQGRDRLHIINLKFDVTPPDLIDMVVTEIGCIPCSSVPVIIREYDVYKHDDI